MNQRIQELAEQAEFSEKDLHIQGDNFQKFAELMIKEFYNICDQAWTANEQSRTKEGLSPAEQMVYAGAQAQCQKMKENIKEYFGVDE